MSKTTTALVHREVKGKSKLETVKLDALADDEALVEIEAVGVCHTDLSCMDGLLPAQLPAVFGHEGGGVVLETGKAVTHVQKGDKVLLSYAHCKVCQLCKTDMPTYCLNFIPYNFGGARPDQSPTMYLENGDKCAAHFFGQSSFARHSIAHSSSIVKVAPDTDLSLYAPLGCGLQTGAGCVINTLKTKPGSSIAVFGVGSVGLAAIMGAKIVGASTIIAVDLQPARLELAKQLGATHIVNGGDDDLVEQVKKLAPPNGVNFAVDCTGVPQVVTKMIECLGTRGRAATVGAPPPGQKAEIDIFNHLVFGREYIGCAEGDSYTPEFIPYLLEQHKKGNFPFEKFVTHYDAKDFQKAFDDMHQGKTIKAILKWT